MYIHTCVCTYVRSYMYIGGYTYVCMQITHASTTNPAQGENREAVVVSESLLGRSISLESLQGGAAPQP